jgi:predicted Zn-dependent protease
MPKCLTQLLSVFALVFCLAGCATNPVTGRSELHLVSEKEEIALGRQHYGEGKQTAGGEFILDPALSAYVRGVLNNVTRVSDRPQLPYEIVIANDSTPNAWAMPGGKLAINRGLLLELKSEAELAAVLAHEVVHAAARHGARQIESSMLIGVGAALISASVSDSRHADLADIAVGIGAGLVGQKYGRDHELEADHYGMAYMARAGYDPQAAVSLQETFLRIAGDKKPGWIEGLLASHPPTQERLDANRRYAATLAGNFRKGEKEYQQAIAALRKLKPAYDEHDKGMKALNEKKYPEALAHEPREALFHTLRGKAREKTGDKRGAEADYDAAIQRNSEYFGPWLHRGQLRLADKRTKEGEADLERSLALLPTAEARLTLGRLAFADGRQDRALKLLQPLADNNSAAGSEAAALVAHMELPTNPGKYLAVEPRLNRSGQVDLVVQNRSRIVVVGIRGMAGIHAGGSRTQGDQGFQIARLPPGASVRVSLPLRPAEFGAPLDALVVRIHSAQAE